MEILTSDIYEKGKTCKECGHNKHSASLLVNKLQTEIAELKTKVTQIEVEAADKLRVLGNERDGLMDLVISLKDGFTFVGSVYCGARLNKRAEGYLEKALSIFRPAQQYIQEQALKESEVKHDNK